MALSPDLSDLSLISEASEEMRLERQVVYRVFISSIICREVKIPIQPYVMIIDLI